VTLRASSCVSRRQRLRCGSSGERIVSCWPDGPALRPERGAELSGAVLAQVRLAAADCAVSRADRGSAPIACLVHDVSPSRAGRAVWGSVSARPRAGAPSASAGPPHRGDHRTLAPSGRRSLARRTAAWRSRLPGRSRRLSGGSDGCSAEANSAGDLAGGRGAGRQRAPGGYPAGPISAPASSA